MNGPKYAAINTKLRAMEAKFLTKEDYHNLILKDDATQIVNYLKQYTFYFKVLQDTKSENIRSSQLEQMLRLSMANSIDGIVKFFTGEYKKFIFTLYAQFEIEDIKILARYLYNKNNSSIYEGLNKLPIGAFIGKYTKLDVNSLNNVTTIKELLEIYSSTKFKAFIKPLLKSNDYNNLFRLEMSLDLGYYSLISKAHDNLSSSDKKILEDAYGVLEDMLNLQWIYRAKKYYNFDSTELFNYTLMGGKNITEARIKRLCEVDDCLKIKDIAGKEYAFLFHDDLQGDIFMERRLERKNYFNLKSLVNKYPQSIVKSFAHIYFLNYQVKDIITIIESARYHLEEEEVKKYLVHYI